MNVFFMYQIQLGWTNSTRITLSSIYSIGSIVLPICIKYSFKDENTTTNNNNDYVFKVPISKGLGLLRPI
jgi:hypothetical protein